MQIKRCPFLRAELFSDAVQVVLNRVVGVLAGHAHGRVNRPLLGHVDGVILGQL